MLKSDLVGEVTLNVDDLCSKGGLREAWFHIVFHRRIKALGDKQAGKVKISTKYVDLNNLQKFQSQVVTSHNTLEENKEAPALRHSVTAPRQTADDLTQAVSRMSVNDGKLRMLLKQVLIKSSAKTSKFSESTFIVICKIRADEWRSKAADNPGLNAEFSFQQCQLAYKSPEN